MRLGSISAINYGVQKNYNLQNNNKAQTPSFGMAVKVDDSVLDFVTDTFVSEGEAKVEAAGRKDISRQIKRLERKALETTKFTLKEAGKRQFGTNAVDKDVWAMMGAIDSQENVLIPMLDQNNRPITDQSGNRILVRLDHPALDQRTYKVQTDDYGEIRWDLVNEASYANPTFDENGDRVYPMPAVGTKEAEQGSAAIVGLAFHRGANYTKPVTIVNDQGVFRIAMSYPINERETLKGNIKGFYKEVDKYTTDIEEFMKRAENRRINWRIQETKRTADTARTHAANEILKRAGRDAHDARRFMDR